MPCTSVTWLLALNLTLRVLTALLGPPFCSSTTATPEKALHGSHKDDKRVVQCVAGAAL